MYIHARLVCVDGGFVAGFGRLDAMAIFFDANGKPDPKALLLQVCQTMCPANGDSLKSEWTECQFAKNLTAKLPFCASWWEHTIITLLSRVKVMVEDDAQSLQRAQQFPDARPVVPKAERRAFYERISTDCASPVNIYGPKILPHERFIDELEHKARTGQPVPVYEVKAMWKRDDRIKTTVMAGRDVQTVALQFALGTDVVETAIHINEWVTSTSV